MVNPNRFYTYAYLREDRTPYYIGKGEKNRIYKKGKDEIKPPKDKSRIIFLKQNLTEEDAFKHEIYMIDVFGRKDLGIGILRNRTNGGEGVSGLIHTLETRKKLSAAQKGKTHSPEARSKISAANTGKTHTPEHIANKSAAQRGRTHSSETKAKMSAAKKGKTFSPETKAKQSAARKGEKNPNYGKTASIETRAKMSTTMKGRTPHNKGKTHSPETIAKMSGENNHNYGKMWITDDNINRMIPRTNIIPEGFRKGFRKGRTLLKPTQGPPTNSTEVV